MMDCNEVRNLMPLHVGGDLESGPTQAVNEHLAACAACSKEFDQGVTLVGVRRAFWKAQSSSVPDFWPAIEARLKPEPAAAVPSLWAHRWAPMAAAAALVVAVSVSMWPRPDPAMALMGANQGLPTVAEAQVPAWPIEGQASETAGTEVLADAQPLEAATAAPAPLSGLRRLAPHEPSLLEEARPWGLEETPAVLRFEENPMRVASGR